MTRDPTRTKFLGKLEQIIHRHILGIRQKISEESESINLMKRQQILKDMLQMCSSDEKKDEPSKPLKHERVKMSKKVSEKSTIVSIQHSSKFIKLLDDEDNDSASIRVHRDIGGMTNIFIGPLLKSCDDNDTLCDYIKKYACSTTSVIKASSYQYIHISASLRKKKGCVELADKLPMIIEKLSTLKLLSSDNYMCTIPVHMFGNSFSCDNEIPLYGNKTDDKEDKDDLSCGFTFGRSSDVVETLDDAKPKKKSKEEIDSNLLCEYVQNSICGRSYNSFNPFL